MKIAIVLDCRYKLIFMKVFIALFMGNKDQLLKIKFVELEPCCMKLCWNINVLWRACQQ
jgi:hypothetical protein